MYLVSEIRTFRGADTNTFCQFQLILQTVKCRVFMCKMGKCTAWVGSLNPFPPEHYSKNVWKNIFQICTTFSQFKHNMMHSFISGQPWATLHASLSTQTLLPSLPCFIHRTTKNGHKQTSTHPKLCRQITYQNKEKRTHHTSPVHPSLAPGLPENRLQNTS